MVTYRARDVIHNIEEHDTMTEIKELQPMSLEEFDSMPKQEGWIYELLDGAIMMAPSPTFEHQHIASNINYLVRSQLAGNKNCTSVSETDVKQSGNSLRPDVAVYCKGDVQIPEIVFEILSPSTRQRDLLVKPIIYQKMGVKECWLIDPMTKTITVHDFINETAYSYTLEQQIQSMARPEISLSVEAVFEKFEF